jgi:hypothetical protein
MYFVTTKLLFFIHLRFTLFLLASSALMALLASMALLAALALLEPLMAGTYVRYPYLGLHGYRALVT